MASQLKPGGSSTPDRGPVVVAREQASPLRPLIEYSEVQQWHLNSQNS